MGNLIRDIKNSLLDKVEAGDNKLLRFPLPKTGKIMNNYVRGDFIVVSGRKTSGKRSFILKNYVLEPIFAKIKYKKALDVRVFYFSTSRGLSPLLEKLSAMYISAEEVKANKDMFYNKVSISSFYNYSNADIAYGKATAKGLLNKAFNVLSKFIEKNYLKFFDGTKTVFEIKNIMKSLFTAYGRYDEDFDTFTYKEEYEDMVPIIIVDDASMVLGEDGKNSIRNDNSAKLGMVLKEMAKTLNAIVVLNVPSASIYTSQKEKIYMNRLEEIGAYSNFADKVLFLHNPQETQDRYVFNYDMLDFINENTGVCYFRHMTIAANTSGPSSVTIPYFFFPQSGEMYELPQETDGEVNNELYGFISLVGQGSLNKASSEDDDDDDKDEIEKLKD